MQLGGKFVDGQWHFTLVLPVDFNETDIRKTLVNMLQDASSKAVEAIVSQSIKPVLQFKVAKVAKMMDITPETVREYMELPADNYKHLVYEVGETKHSDRIPLTSLLEWMERNKSHRSYSKLKNQLSNKGEGGAKWVVR